MKRKEKYDQNDNIEKNIKNEPNKFEEKPA